jgi:hypothetical protein
LLAPGTSISVPRFMSYIEGMTDPGCPGDFEQTGREHAIYSAIRTSHARLY